MNAISFPSADIVNSVAPELTDSTSLLFAELSLFI